MQNDSVNYKACELKNFVSKNYYQFAREYQIGMDEVIKISPTYADAYEAKSVAYLKSGDFLTWKKLIDKAVELAPNDYLGYRGWCRYQFFRDYKGAISDIEMLEKSVPDVLNLGYSANGDYHLIMAKAICYSAIGEKMKAIEIMDNLLKTEGYNPGAYDYYQLGVTYFETGDFKTALKCFDRQSQIQDYAENEYYKAMIYKALEMSEKYELHKKNAIKFYKEEMIIQDGYTHHFNKVYYETILKG